MRGSIKERYEGSWSLILELGYQPDPKTGAMKRKQKWGSVSFGSAGPAFAPDPVRQIPPSRPCSRG